MKNFGCDYVADKKGFFILRQAGMVSALELSIATDEFVKCNRC
jgi:hypothetical protein